MKESKLLDLSFQSGEGHVKVSAESPLLLGFDLKSGGVIASAHTRTKLMTFLICRNII